MKKLMPSRNGEVRDVCIDQLGIVLRILAVIAIEMLLANSRKNI